MKGKAIGISNMTRQIIKERVNDYEQMYKAHNIRELGLLRLCSYHTAVACVYDGDNDEWRYGVEYELSFYPLWLFECGEWWTDYNVVIGKIASAVIDRNVNYHQGGVTRDQSIPNGMEIVLAPMGIEKIKRTINAVLNDRHIAPFIDHDFIQAALHVTVDPFNTLEEQRAFHDFWNHANLFEDFISIIGREENVFCRRRKRIYKKGLFMKHDTLRSHYHRCNVRINGGAMEVRVFKAHPDLLHKQLVMVDLVNKAVRLEKLRKYTSISQYVREQMAKENEGNI